MKSHHPLRFPVLLGVLIVLLFSCSDNEDKRKVVTDELGPPDDIRRSEFAGMKSELYIYARKDINRTYEFRKTVGGCGGSGQWYVYRMYYTNYLFPDIELYLPPTIKHTPVESAPPGQEIEITAEVKDDEEVVSVTLYYRATGQEDFLSVRMTGGEEGMYTASIPAEAVTTAGVEYYIEAFDDGEHSSELPEDGVYSITVSSSEKAVARGTPESNARTMTPVVLPVPDDVPYDTSPVGP